MEKTLTVTWKVVSSDPALGTVRVEYSCEGAEKVMPHIIFLQKDGPPLEELIARNVPWQHFAYVLHVTKANVAEHVGKSGTLSRDIKII